jgi:hypothetical protein
MENKETYVFLDTMVYLHYLPVVELELRKLLKAVYVIILIPEITIRELEKHKLENNSKKIRQRARDRLEIIKKWIIEEKITSEIGVKLISERPKINFEEYELERNWNDHQLLASFIGFIKENKNKRVILLTQDNGLFIKTKGLNFEVIMLPENKKLPKEEDPLVKENKELRNKLYQYELAKPELIIRFSDTEDDIIFREFEIMKSQKEFTNETEKNIRELKDKFPEMHPRKKDEVKINFGAIDLSKTISAIYNDIPESEYKRYNKDRENYLSKMRDYLIKKEKYQTIPERRIIIDLELRNIGKVPGDDIDIYIHFPNGFEVYPNDNQPIEPTMPREPIKPRSKLNMGVINSLPTFNNFYPVPQVHSISRNSFKLTKTDSYELEYNVKKLKHGYIHPIKELLIIFPCYKEAKSFNFDYTITADNLLEPERGTLNVVINKT